MHFLSLYVRLMTMYAPPSPPPPTHTLPPLYVWTVSRRASDMLFVSGTVARVDIKRRDAAQPIRQYVTICLMKLRVCKPLFWQVFFELNFVSSQLYERILQVLMVTIFLVLWRRVPFTHGLSHCSKRLGTHQPLSLVLHSIQRNDILDPSPFFPNCR